MVRYHPPDTTPEAWAVQMEIYRRMTPQRRSELAAELSDNMRRVAAEGVRKRHPEYSEEEIRLAVIRLSIGEELFREAYPDCKVAP